MNELNEEEERIFEKLLASEAPINIENTTKALKEVKQILESYGITFFLMSGSCLGAIRENGLIPWDDDVDIGSVYGLHGCKEESLGEIITTFRKEGFITKLMYTGPHAFLPFIKYSAKISWECLQVIDGYVEQYPFLNTPVSFYTNLKEIDFLGEKFYVPNPPEEYLRLKYGEEWRVPKKHGSYEIDVINQVIAEWTTEEAGASKSLNIPGGESCKFKVLDDGGEPVTGAKVIVIGLGNRKTDENGYAEFYMSKDDFYPIVIRYGDYEKIDYFPQINRGEEYTYKLE
ncbi:LicD family protein [Chloroflexota bacterium]